MEKIEQINLKLPKNLIDVAKKYVDNYGYRNIQELLAESIREKVFENNEFDETFEEKDIELIENLIDTSIKGKGIVSEQKLMKTLLK